MTGNLRFLLGCSVFALLPFGVNAAGTYYDYNGTVQRNYNKSYNSNPFYNYGNGNTNGKQTYGCQGLNCSGDVNNNGQNVQLNKTGKVKRNTNNKDAQPTKNGGLSVDAGISHQFASWNFDMKTAGSELGYNNLHWNVFDAGLKYDFNWGNTMVRLGGGLQYGVQFGESPMVDDDITGGGYSLQKWNVDLNNDGVVDQIWHQGGHALSIGKSSGGDMFGLHAGIGLVDVWHLGGVKMTPSVGYRYFKYKLETKRNYGLSLDTVSGADNYCQTIGGETQCLPFLVFVDQNNSAILGTIGGVDLDGDGYVDTVSYVAVPSGAEYVETENTYYYYQDGVSHSYEVEWTGPYVALDMQYDITRDDAVNARVEFGLPSYKSTADQPYRPDWQHPKSLEDEGGFGDAYHFGMGANWLHSLSDSVMLTLGMTFDYYKVSGADATSYLNADYYNTYYYDPAVSDNTWLANTYGSTNYLNWTAVSGRNLSSDQAIYENNLETIAVIDDLKAGGWQQKSSGEIESLYKSLGVRIGIQAKF